MPSNIFDAYLSSADQLPKMHMNSDVSKQHSVSALQPTTVVHSIDPSSEGGPATQFHKSMLIADAELCTHRVQQCGYLMVHN